MMITHVDPRPGAPRGQPLGRRARRGITIIEVVVLMTGVATMLGLCAVTIQALFRVGGEGQARLSAAAALDRLAGQFRADVHACDQAVLGTKAEGQPARDGAAANLRLTLGPGLVVTYEAREGRVARVESGAGAGPRRESYHLVPGAVVRFEARDEGPRRFLALVLTRRTARGAVDPPRPLEVLALRGKHRIGRSPAEGGQSR
jgi:hypothetical protein